MLRYILLRVIRTECLNIMLTIAQAYQSKPKKASGKSSGPFSARRIALARRESGNVEWARVPTNAGFATLARGTDKWKMKQRFAAEGCDRRLWRHPICVFVLSSDGDYVPSPGWSLQPEFPCVPARCCWWNSFGSSPRPSPASKTRRPSLSACLMSDLRTACKANLYSCRPSKLPMSE